MSLKDRLKIKKADSSNKSIVENNFEKDVLLEKFLNNAENIIVCCPLGISTKDGITFVAEKIKNENRLVVIGENLPINKNEIIKFEPETNGVSKELIKTSLDLKPDKILLQNFIGKEAVDIFRLVNADIKNVITCVEASDEIKALRQIELNLCLSGVNISGDLMQKMIFDFADKIVVLKSTNDFIFVDKVCEIKSIKDGDFIVTEMIQAKEITSNDFDGFNKEIINQKLENVLTEEISVKSQKPKNILAKKIKRNKLKV